MTDARPDRPVLVGTNTPDHVQQLVWTARDTATGDRRRSLTGDATNR